MKKFLVILIFSLFSSFLYCSTTIEVEKFPSLEMAMITQRVRNPWKDFSITLVLDLYNPWQAAPASSSSWVCRDLDHREYDPRQRGLNFQSYQVSSLISCMPKVFHCNGPESIVLLKSCERDVKESCEFVIVTSLKNELDLMDLIRRRDLGEITHFHVILFDLIESPFQTITM